jgi:hypothetical protein
MICPNCGKEIKNDSEFCTYCGTKLDKKTQELNDSIDGKVEFEKKSIIKCFLLGLPSGFLASLAFMFGLITVMVETAEILSQLVVIGIFHGFALVLARWSRDNYKKVAESTKYTKLSKVAKVYVIILFIFNFTLITLNIAFQLFLLLSINVL